MTRPPEKLPDPWLFDSEALLRELDRCRELVLQIPATTHATHFAANIAIDAIWNLREHLRFLLSLHREGQRQFSRRATAQSASVLDTKLHDFRRRAAPFVTQLPATEWDWLALAQHHGLSTRLLDWTENPLVATYFAVEKLSKTDRVLYMIDIENISVADEETSPFSLDGTVVYRPTHLSARISSQGGLFTAHGKPHEVFEHPTLERWIIKGGSCALDLLVTLHTYGINPASIFRDLDSLAQTLNSHYVRGPAKTEPHSGTDHK